LPDFCPSTGENKSRDGRPATAVPRRPAVDDFRYPCRPETAAVSDIALVDLAFLATWEGRPEDAVRLTAAFESVRASVGGPPGGFAALLEGDPAEEARANLSEDAAHRAWEIDWP
jgi:hypothetical protein